MQEYQQLDRTLTHERDIYIDTFYEKKLGGHRSKFFAIDQYVSPTPKLYETAKSTKICHFMPKFYNS